MLYCVFDLIKLELKLKRTGKILQPLTALAEPTRRRIVELLADGPLSSGDIASRFHISAPAISQHLRALREVHLVKVRPAAQKRFYELDQEGVEQLAQWVNDLKKFWSTKLDALETALRK